MTPAISNSLTFPIAACLRTLILVFLLLGLSACSTYIASKQDDLLTQIDVWSAEQEFGKALETLDFVKTTHPQHNDLQKRKTTLLTEAREFEQKVHNRIVKLIQRRQWSQALDLIDDARKKYPQGKTIPKTEQMLLKKQALALAEIDQKIMIERSRWMIRTRPIYQSKLKTDPRNEALKAQLESINTEADSLAQQLTLLANQAIEKKHYKTARMHIRQAIELKPSKKRDKILASLRTREKVTVKKQKQAQKLTHEKKQNTLLLEIEKSFRAGDLINAKQLITSLDDKERQNPELIQLQQELDRAINITIQNHFSKANKLYTEGEFEQAITIWEQVLYYDPENETARKNIDRAEKVIEKLSTLREKQQN